MSQKFFVLQSLWSDTAKRVLLPGEQATLDDLSDDQIAKLTAGNVITPWVETPSASAGASTSNPPTAESDHAAAAAALTANDGVQSAPTVVVGATPDHGAAG